MQECHHFFAFVALSTVLQKVGGLVVVHPEQERLPEHLHVHICSRSWWSWGKKVQGTPAANARKAAPHHHAHRVLNIDHHVLLLVVVGLPCPLGPWVHKPESRLVRKHYFSPVFVGPLPGLPAELQPLPDHPCC